jgi:hypothetical protein
MAGALMAEIDPDWILDPFLARRLSQIGSMVSPVRRAHVGSVHVDVAGLRRYQLADLGIGFVLRRTSNSVMPSSAMTNAAETRNQKGVDGERLSIDPTRHRGEGQPSVTRVNVTLKPARAI